MQRYDDRDSEGVLRDQWPDLVKGGGKQSSISIEMIDTGRTEDLTEIGD